MSSEVFNFKMGTAPVALAVGARAALRPQWQVDTGELILSSGVVADEEPLRSSSSGSHRWLWNDADDVWFAEGTAALVFCRFRVPEAQFQVPTQRADWRDAERVEGQLFAPGTREFSCRSATQRAGLGAPASLVCVESADHPWGGVRHTVLLAEDFSLLVLDGHMVGWTLQNAAHHLTSYGMLPLPSEPSAQFEACVADYLALVTSSGVEMMEARDHDTGVALNALLSRVRRAPDPAERTLPLQRRLVQVLDLFYG